MRDRTGSVLVVVLVVAVHRAGEWSLIINYINFVAITSCVVMCSRAFTVIAVEITSEAHYRRISNNRDMCIVCYAQRQFVNAYRVSASHRRCTITVQHRRHRLSGGGGKNLYLKYLFNSRVSCLILLGSDPVLGPSLALRFLV